jgi:rhamnose transport system substrate-binding protein
MEAVYDLADGEGKWAILSATSQAANQNAWIDAMKEIMKDEKYSKLELVEVAYGDDEPQKSTDQTQALLEKYSDLKVICAPTTVGINAAAKVLQDKGSSVKLTGLGLPSEMAEYIGEDDEHSCPYMYLWNPIDVGKLGAYVSIALVEGDITGAEGETFTAGDLGEYTIVDAGDGGTEIILGAPFKFDPSNIEEWKEIY